MAHLTYPEATVVGLIQGVSEMFPISSLGHNVLIPALVGGSWAQDLSVASPESPYLPFIVGLHVATAIALLVYFRRDWIRISGGFLSLRDRRIEPADQQLAWMIILATIPVGIAGVAFEHALRVVFGKLEIAGIFLAINGIILLAGERYRTRASVAADAAVVTAREPALVAAGRHSSGARTVRLRAEAGTLTADRRLASMSYPQAVVIGSAQILAAGALKIPDLVGPLGNGIRGPILVGSVLSGIGAYLSVRFLLRYLRTRSLFPFGIYCLIAGLASVAYLGLAR